MFAFSGNHSTKSWCQELVPELLPGICCLLLVEAIQPISNNQSLARPMARPTGTAQIERRNPSKAESVFVDQDSSELATARRPYFGIPVRDLQRIREGLYHLKPNRRRRVLSFRVEPHGLTAVAPRHTLHTAEPSDLRRP